MHCTLTPAYGRNPKSGPDAIADLTGGKDWILNDPQSRWDGRYVNLPQLIDVGYKTVKLRFRRLRSETTVNIAHLKEETVG